MYGIRTDHARSLIRAGIATNSVGYQQSWRAEIELVMSTARRKKSGQKYQIWRKKATHYNLHSTRKNNIELINYSKGVKKGRNNAGSR